MIRCTRCNRTLEEVQKQDGVLFLLNYGESFMCNPCREREESENYWNGMRVLFKVKEKDDQIAKLKQSQKQFALKVLDELKQDAYSKETWSCGQVEGLIEAKIDEIKDGKIEGEQNE